MKLYRKPIDRLIRKWERLVVPRELRDDLELAISFAKLQPENSIEKLAQKMTLGELVRKIPQAKPAWGEFLKAERMKNE